MKAKESNTPIQRLLNVINAFANDEQDQEFSDNDRKQIDELAKKLLFDICRDSQTQKKNPEPGPSYKKREERV